MGYSEPSPPREAIIILTGIAMGRSLAIQKTHNPSKIRRQPNSAREVNLLSTSMLEKNKGIQGAPIVGNRRKA